MASVTRSRMFYSRWIGALFLLGFLFYGVGFGALVTPLVSAPNFLSTISAHQTVLVIGALLMLLNTAVDVGKAVLFFPILEPHGKRTALTYLATMIIEVAFLSVGVIGILMVVTLGQASVGAGAVGAGSTKILGSLALQWNTMAYQIGEMTLGFGATFLCWLLYRTRLIPRLLAGLGVIGYVLLMAGAIVELFGIHIGVMLSVPGLIFEVGLGLWLLIKGFNPEAYGEVV